MGPGIFTSGLLEGFVVARYDGTACTDDILVFGPRSKMLTAILSAH
jgi:hypothetical protein